MNVFALGYGIDECLLGPNSCPGTSGGTAAFGGRWYSSRSNGCDKDNPQFDP